MKLCKFCMNEFDGEQCPKEYCNDFIAYCLQERIPKICKNCNELFLAYSVKNIVCSTCIRITYNKAKIKYTENNREKGRAYQREYRKRKLSTS